MNSRLGVSSLTYCSALTSGVHCIKFDIDCLFVLFFVSRKVILKNLMYGKKKSKVKSRAAIDP